MNTTLATPYYTAMTHTRVCVIPFSPCDCVTESDVLITIENACYENKHSSCLDLPRFVFAARIKKVRSAKKGTDLQITMYSDQSQQAVIASYELDNDALTRAVQRLVYDNAITHYRATNNLRIDFESRVYPISVIAVNYE